jgi:hypothetical protein
MSSDIDDFYSALAELFTARWRDHALCADYDLELFSDDERVKYAKRICNDCPVKIECLDSALYYNDGFVRGGLTESERNSVELHRKRHLAALRYDISIS